MPRQASGIITTLTTLAGRANRGRKYVPFPSEDANTVDAIPGAAYITALDGYAGSLIPSASFTIGAVNEVWNPIILRVGAPATSPNIQEWKSRLRWATQRRRGSYGTPNLPPG